MKTMTRSILFLTLAVSSLACAESTAYGFTPLAPTGPHQVGVLELNRVDPDREEPFGRRGEQRQYTLSVWYPAAPTGEEALRPYLGRLTAEDLTKAQSQLPEGVAEALAQASSSAFIEAPVSQAQSRWPVLLFSHGFMGIPEVYTSTLQELASHGYVVVALNYTGQAAVTRFDEERVEYGRRRLLRLMLQSLPGMSLTNMEPGPEKAKQTEKALKKAKLIQQINALWVGDLQDTLDLLAEAEQGIVPDLEALSGRLDLTRVGALGHSLGGAVSAELARVDARIQAAVNWDGFQSGGVYGSDLQAPLLFVESGSMPGLNEMIYTEVSALEQADLHELRHGGLCDLPLIEGMDPEEYEKQFGTSDPTVYLPALHDLTRGFFDRHLAAL